MIAAIAFLTPLGRAREPDPGTLDWFPVVGALLGAAVGAVWWGAGELWPPLLAATLAVASDVALTGALHVDGLADTADGLVPHLERDRRLAVMAEPAVGAFGITAVVLAFGLRVAALASLRPDPGLLAALWCGSRTVMAVTARSLPYARPGTGLAAAFLGRSPGRVAAAGAALATAIALTATEVGAAHALAALAALAAAGAAVVALARRRLGGFTGDVLGAAGVVGETAALLVAAARW